VKSDKLSFSLNGARNAVSVLAVVNAVASKLQSEFSSGPDPAAIVGNAVP
jgi:hypothetical protein